MDGALRRYVSGGHRSVAGWLSQRAIDALVLLGQAQRRLGVQGGVCEIGIHHGRSFVLLHLLAPGPSAAYDLFELQGENTDHSGFGDKQAFLSNLQRHGCDIEQVSVKSRNSLALTPDEILVDAGGPVRIFSVDGGHTAEVTQNDMRLAEATLARGGLLMLDDFFNEAWPAVAEGACRHLFSGSKLIPVAIGGNKFIFTNDPTYAEQYRAALSPLSNCKMETSFGSPVVVMQPRGNALISHLAQLWLWKAIRGNAAGRLIRKFALRSLGR